MPTRGRHLKSADSLQWRRAAHRGGFLWSRWSPGRRPSSFRSTVLSPTGRPRRSQPNHVPDRGRDRRPCGPGAGSSSRWCRGQTSLSRPAIGECGSRVTPSAQGRSESHDPGPAGSSWTRWSDGWSGRRSTRGQIRAGSFRRTPCPASWGCRRRRPSVCGWRCDHGRAGSDAHGCARSSRAPHPWSCPSPDRRPCRDWSVSTDARRR